MNDTIVTVMHRQHGVISRNQALEAGLSSRQIQRRLSSGVWVGAARGVYRHHLVRSTWWARLLVACLRYDGMASHRSAGVLQSLDGFRPGRCEIVVARGRWSPPADITLHQSTQMDRVEVELINGIPCTGLARTVLDLAAVLNRSDLEDVIDGVLREGRLDLAALYDVLIRPSRKGRDGCGRLRTVLDERMGDDTIPLSRWSRMVGALLVSHGLPTPEYEHTVHDEGGRFLGQVDLAYPSARLAIELDSVRWHMNRESFEKDPLRRNQITVARWTVLNFTWKRYVDDPIGLCREVSSLLGSSSLPRR